jgi:hypothetical protein
MSVLTQLWAVDSYTLIEAMVSMYDEAPASLSRILDIAQELKVLHPNLTDATNLDLGTEDDTRLLSPIHLCSRPSFSSFQPRPLKPSSVGGRDDRAIWK